MKIRKLLVAFVLLFSAIGFSQTPANSGFENGSINAGTDWAGHAGTGTSTVTTTNARTGVYSLNHTTTSNAAAPTQDNVSATIISIPANWYCHAIGWARGVDANSRAQMRTTLVGVASYSGTQSAVGALNGTLLRLTATSNMNGTGSAVNGYCRASSRANTNAVTTTIYWDDIIMYTSNSATIDITQPSAATGFTPGATLANSVTFTWTNGTDGAAPATGIQNTIILRTTVGSPTTPVMNDQGLYSTGGGTTGPNTVSTDWTVISTGVSSAATSYTDTTVSAGVTYKYAVIHRDLAYNYSPALVSGAITCPPSVITSTTTGGLWSVGSTWVGGVVPASGTDAIIATGAIVTLDGAPNNTRNLGTVTTVNAGGTLATGAFAYNNNGSTTINGTFQLDTGGSVTGNDFTYGGASTLVLNTTVTVSNTDQYWPTSGPYNVTVLSGGLTMNSANRTVAGVFQTAAGVTLTSTTLTLNLTCQINSGGFFTSGSPTYGSSSTLIYNTGGSYLVNNEWTGSTVPPSLATVGTPQNVIVQNSTTLTMPASSRSMAGDLNINSGNFTLSASADLYIAGNWTRASAASFTPGSRKVFFSSGTANATHTVTVSGGGTETFYSIEIQFTGTLKLASTPNATNVNVTGNNGVTLNSTNATSTIDLNGQILNVSGGGTLGWVGGARKITSTLANGTFVVSGSILTVSLGGAGTLSTDTNTIVKLQQGFNPGVGITTINGTLQIDSGGFITFNAPFYGSSSTLSYISGGSYMRSLEFSATTGPIGTTAGFPNNVLITNSTTLNYYNGSYTGAKAINGNLDINAGSSLSFGGTTTGGALTVPGNITNAGTLSLGVANGDDLIIGGNYSNTGAGTFTGNSRAVFFNKAGTQTVSSVTPLTIPFLRTSGGGTTVQLLSDLIISSSSTGTNVIIFGNASDIIDINGKNVTIGATGNPGNISGTGTFKGSTASNLTILGTGSVGTVSFTSGFQNLGTFTMNRQSGVIGCALGSPLTVNTSLALTNGLIDLGTTSTNNLTLSASATISGGSAGSYVLAYLTAGNGGQLIKTFSAAPGTPFAYPIGDNTGSLHYSPATLIFAGGTYPGTFGARAVYATHPSNTGTDHLNKYWQVLVSGIAPTSYTFVGTYTAPGEITGAEANCLPQCYNGSSWTNIGATAISSSACTVTGSSLNTNSDFYAQTGSLYYRSKTPGGDWSVPGTWESSTDNATWGPAAAAPNSSANTITILATHTVTITSPVTIDQVYVSGTLNATGASYAVTLNNGVGTDLTINTGGTVAMSISGTLSTHGWIVTGTSIAVLASGTYVHNTARAVSAFLDQTTFNATSTMIYRGSSTVVPAVSLSSRTFGHLRFESTSGTMTIPLPTFTTTCTSTDFFIGSNVNLTANTNSLYAVSGDFTNNGTMNNSAGYFNFNFSGTTKTISGSAVPNFDTVNVTGSYTLNTNISMGYTSSFPGTITVATGGVLNNGGENQIIGNGSVVVTGKFITQDAQGFTGTNAAIPTLTTTVGTASTVEYGGPSQTITAFTTYNNVTVSGSGTKTLLTTPISMNGDLNVNASILLVSTNQVIEVKKAVNVASIATFEIQNNGQLVQIDDTANAANVYVGSNTGNIIYNRAATAIKGYDYVYWGSPVTGQDVSTIYTSPSPGFKYFWNPLATNINTASTGTSGIWQLASGLMIPAKGYIIRGSSSYGMTATNIPVVFTGVPNNGVITTTISRGGNTTASQTGANGATVTNYDDNWNLVGNPYPSAILATEFLKPTNNPNIQGFINLWTHSTAPVSTTNPFYNSFVANYTSSDYITYNAAGSQSGPFAFNGYIKAGQSFFVSMNDGATGNSTVNFNNSMRSKTHVNNQFFRTGTQPVEEDNNRIWLDLVDSNNEAVRTLVGYFPEATVGLDRMYDAFKNVANDKNIYSLAEDKTLIIQGRPSPLDQNDEVPIGVRILSAGDYKIAVAAVDGLFSDTEQNIYLEDRELNVIYDLRQNPYSFTSAAGTFNDRFVLRYTNALANPDFGDINGSVVLAANHGELIIKSAIENIQEVTVYDVLGRQLFFAKGISNTNFVTSTISASQQTLVVKIKLENGMTISRKIIL